MKKEKPALLLLFLLLTGCFNPDKYLQPVDYKDLVQFVRPLSRTIVADDSSSTLVEVTFPANVTDSNKTVTINTTTGYFADNGKRSIQLPSKIIKSEGENKRVSSVRLKGGVIEGDAIITAKVGDTPSADTLTVKFLKAYPTQIKLDLSSFSVKSSFGSELTLTATVSRKKGKPSVGNLVSFSVINALSGNSIGEFRSLNDLSNDKGVATVIFGIKDDCCIGDARAVVSVKDSLGNTLTTSKNIAITK
ncbi:glycosyltransferase family 17 protein [Spirosoma agri]|uniref:Big-1 domain-containing protein n=1 Tax=Spirosoma agri TaxID=1987381 RepID=A0A6M0ILL0_9BACT|nr:hypothetical protein [Spirosoma agri]NEU67783.1 hypothetical protein [Spirosoma agri]